MPWMAMRRSVPCVLRHHGDAANDPQFRRATDPRSRRPRHARRWLAVFLLLPVVAAFCLARPDAPAPTAHEAVSWRAACLIAVLGDTHLNHGSCENPRPGGTALLAK
jgi:hypothetical protein